MKQIMFLFLLASGFAVISWIAGDYANSGGNLLEFQAACIAILSMFSAVVVLGFLLMAIWRELNL